LAHIEKKVLTFDLLSLQKTTAKRSRSTSQGRRRSSRSRSRSTTRKQTPTSNGSATKAANGAAKARSAPSTPTRFSRRIQENAEKQIQVGGASLDQPQYQDFHYSKGATAWLFYLTDILTLRSLLGNN